MQDLLGLDGGSRMNKPGLAEGNWSWRVRGEAFNDQVAGRLREMLALYGEMAPMARNITQDEVGRAGAYLLSNLSDGVTGDILHLDGGYHIMGSPGRLLDRFRE